MIVWIASYPRSGNTFLRVILNKVYGINTYSIHQDRTDIAEDEKTSDVVGHQALPDGFDLASMRGDEETYYIKTHELPDDSIDDSDKVIYLLRDGRECVLSYQRYISNFGSSGKVVEDIIYGNVYFGGWGQHVKAWHPDTRGHTLLIKFEQLIEAPERFLNIISDFTGVQPNCETIPLFDDLNKINPKFFNSGKKNSWKTVFSEEEHLAFCMKNHAQMLKYGYTNDLPAVFSDETSVLLFRQISAENTYLLKELLAVKKTMVEEHSKTISTLLMKMEKIKALASDKKDIINQKDSKINELNSTLSAIKNSRSYRFSEFLAKLAGRRKSHE